MCFGILICFSGKLTFEISQHQHIAYATISDRAVVLKFVNNARGGSEINLLEHLHRTSTPDNHTIPFTIVLPAQNGTIIAMPHLDPLNECGSFSVRTTAMLARQLLEAVYFMHTNGVVHRDLKPENVVVDDDELRLFVIDYDLAEQVDGRDHEVSGYVGTDGFMAPEIRQCEKREGAYCAIPADLWAAGNLLEYLLFKCDEPKSSALAMLWSISSLLMNNNPTQRPSAKQALAMLDTLSENSIPTSLAVADASESSCAAPAEWLTHPVSLTAH
jgi:serine/threonine protein kinase